MTATTTLADRAKGTAFEILYTRTPTSPAQDMTTKERAAEKALADNKKAYQRAKARREAAAKPAPERNSLHSLSKRTGAMRDNKQYARWTI